MTVSSKRQTRNPPSLPAFTLGAVLGLDCLPAAADAGQHNGQAFYTLDPKHVIALDGGDALVILANGQSLLVSQGQFGRDAQGNFVITDAALADDMVQRFGGRPSYSADNVEPGGVALHAEPPEGYQPGTAAAGELDGSSLRMQAPLAGAVGAGGLSAAGAVTAAFVPMAAIPVAAISLNEPGGALDSPADPQPDPADPQPDPGDPQPDPGNPQPDPGGPQQLAGFVINGVTLGEGLGWSVASAGDVNGDGYDDIVIGAPRADGGAGKSYVIFGKAGGFDPRFELSTLDGTNGFVLEGIARHDRSGTSVASAGDINNDGYGDIIVGSPDVNGRGSSRDSAQAYLIFGQPDAYDPSVNLATFNSTHGTKITGIDGSHKWSGISVASAGDFNGDGIDDIIIGSDYGNSGAGKSYLLFGKNSQAGESFGSDMDLSALNLPDGFAMTGLSAGDRYGRSVSSAGDINGDGYADIIIGAPQVDPNNGGITNAGESYVIYGKSMQAIQQDSPNHIYSVIIGLGHHDNTGHSVSTAGDFNGDGFADVIIGAPDADFDQKRDIGKCYLLFGGADGFGARPDLASLTGSNGLLILGINSTDYSGYSVSSAGDINGDGLGDVIIGAYGADGKRGSGYVVFGKTDQAREQDDGSLNLSELNGRNGFVIRGIDASDQSGWSVSGAGDLNNDSFDDILVGAREADANGNSNAGETYVIFGMETFGAVVELDALPGLA